MIKFIFILLGALVLILPLKTLAQLENVPQPITDLFNTFQKIDLNVKLPFLEKAFQEGIPKSTGGGGGVVSDLTNLFDRVSSWFRDKLGVSLIDIVKAIGNFIIWVLEFIVKLIKAGLSFI